METQKDDIALLLVDDELDFLDATATALRRRGFTVLTAPDGETALRVLGQEPLDVVVLDVKMPGIDGVDVFRHVKRFWPNTAVILLTGHGTVQQAFETSKGGVFGYLTKPCDIGELARLARDAAQHSAAASGTNARRVARKIRLLFVDDEPELLESLFRSLTRRGLVVTTAQDGADALQLAQREAFDVALVDVKMPGMDGLTLLKRIRQAQPMIEVILLTGHPSMITAVEAMEHGAFDVLPKPQGPDALVARIQDAFRAREKRRQQEHERRVRELVGGRTD